MQFRNASKNYLKYKFYNMTINKNAQIALMLLFIATTPLFSQTEKTETLTRTFENTTARIEKEKVPFLVADAFYKNKPTSKNENWYGYPKQNISTNWFNDVVNETDLPMYYMVEFTNDTLLQRLTYNSLGEIIDTHKTIDPEIQTKIATAIIASKYKNWKITNEKKELFRDLDLDTLIIYKVEINKENEKRFLFFSENGLLIKDEVIKVLDNKS